ncbi:hypothetical protein [Streptomyces otsuchiensis]|uniref:hypothetical protein n=1 Tax=Streptomyces otsuchiensis TaxID=2681388 RepID=UPI00102F62C0|nr:hypothetical protein [Streptomyces otsuchiensis]
MRSTSRRLAASLGAAGLLLVAGCGGDAATASADEEIEAVEPEPTAALDADEAQAVLDHYIEINNQANHDLDSDLIATIEGGSLYLRSNATFEYVTAQPEDEREDYESFAYENARFYIPVDGEPWFMAVATPDWDDPLDRLLTFAAQEEGDGEDDGEKWKMVSALAIPEDVEFPEIALDADGFAEAVPDDSDHGNLQPDQIARAYSDLRLTAGEGWGGHLADSEPKEIALEEHQEALDITADRESLLKRDFMSHTEEPGLYSLRTADGGSLTVAPVAHGMRQTADRAGVEVTPGDAMIAWDMTPRTAVNATFVGEVVAHIPPDEAPNLFSARIRVIDGY